MGIRGLLVEGAGKALRGVGGRLGVGGELGAD